MNQDVPKKNMSPVGMIALVLAVIALILSITALTQSSGVRTELTRQMETLQSDLQDQIQALSEISPDATVEPPTE